MVLEISPLQEDEMPEWQTIATLAFQSGIGHLLTGPTTPENISKHTELALKDFKNPACRFLKVTDSETGEMVAGSMWFLYPNGNSEAELAEILKMPTVEEGYRVDWDPIYRYLKGNRREIMGTRPYYYLNILCTHPKHHRRGAGAMLIKWGIEEADRLGLECYLEGSKEGRPLYERNGFKVEKEVTFDMADFGRPDLGIDVNCPMRRPVMEKRE